ncbi:hypothetical protein [Pseudomonas sp. Xaverov 259]|nr:hypothetical protein [Pseudomonas sp. Xaverov 259]
MINASGRPDTLENVAAAQDNTLRQVRKFKVGNIKYLSIENKK